jgi:hypothetical protein
MTTTQATTKIVIVAGQEFSVPANTDNEAIRQQLTSMGFADVASATIQKGTRDVDGVKTETIEFVKKAGTKGMDGAELAALLADVPPAPLGQQTHGLTSAQHALLTRLLNERLTIHEAIGSAEATATIDQALGDGVTYPHRTTQGGMQCAPIDALPVVAACASCAW